MNISDNKFPPFFFEKNLKEISMDDLKEIVLQYPYFTTAQFFLSKKMKEENHPAFMQQAQKTAVYFANPSWFQYLLMHDNSNELSTITETKADNNTITQTSETVAKPTTENHLNKKENQSLSEDVQKVLTQDLAEDIQQVLAENLGETELQHLPGLKIAEMLKNHAADFKKAVDADVKLPYGTEPYHTIDYFASQGIKLDLQTQDKLGIKVRRFTDWLKQMKSINPHPADLGTDTALEDKVQDTAAISNEPKEVLTESMAEVLIKQGKIDPAIQLYIKLSFLNPHKSAYFASQIENLKGL